MNCYVLYKNIWGDFGHRIEGKELTGIILAQDLESARWKAGVCKIDFDKIELLQAETCLGVYRPTD